jgi:glutaredoxin/glutathione-dependent peroxiredoxin
MARFVPMWLSRAPDAQAAQSAATDNPADPLPGSPRRRKDRVHNDQESDMTVTVGDKIPDVEVKVLGADGLPASVSTGEVLGTGKVVLFGVPGAFTPACSKAHLPGYVAGADTLAGKGVDTIACTAINDAWVLDAWADSQGAKGMITMLADGNGSFAEAMGLAFDGSPFGLGKRSLRYAAVIEDGVISRLEVEENRSDVAVSSCNNVLAGL